MVFEKPKAGIKSAILEALYSDGVTGHRHSVALRVKRSSLLFRTETGQITEWPYRLIDHDRTIWGKKSAHFYHQDQIDAELVVKDPNTLRKLHSSYESWRKVHIIDRYRSSFSGVRVSFLTCLCFFIMWFLWPFVADQVAPYVSQDIRQQLGDLSYTEYVGSHHVCHSPKAAEAFLKIEDRLLGTHNFVIKPTIVIIQSSSINAVTLPDNRVVFTSSLLEQAQSSDEVAGVLAHEFGHALHDHVIRSVLRRMPVMIIIHALGKSINFYSQALDLFIGNAFSQRFESEADQSGLDLLDEAHISNKGLVNFFERLGHEQSQLEIKYLSTHPPSKERAEKIAERVINNPQTVLTEEDWKSLHHACSDEDNPLISHKIGNFLEDQLDRTDTAEKKP